MAQFPRWNRLKHFNSVTTSRFTDGNAFYDILKVRRMSFELISMPMMTLGTLVHYSLYRGLSPEGFRSSTLHSRLCYVPDSCWPDVHDRESPRVTAECTQGLSKILHRRSFQHSLFMFL